MSKQTFNYLESNLLRVLSGNFLLTSVLILNILTLLSTIWTISKFDLLKDKQINKFIIQRNDPLRLIFAEDVSVYTLIPESSVSLSKIRAKEVSLSSGPQLDRSGIHMVQNSIIMQAQEFYVGSESLDKSDDFELPSQIKFAEVWNGLNDVSTIKSILDSNKKDHLSVSSRGSLKLSGNRGLTISGRRFNIISSDNISLRSRRENLLMLATKGICLPNLTKEGKLSENLKNKLEKRMNICVEKSSGLIKYCQLDR